MPNLIDYLKTYSEIRFSKLKFNELDAAVFAAAAYCHFERIPLTIFKFKNMSQSMKDEALRDTSHTDFFSKILDYLCSSPRYRDIRVSKTLNIFSIEDSTQFCGFLFSINALSGVIAYRGTDNSILGWKEDFEMGYKGEVPAHREALKFFKLVRSVHCLKTFYIVGHSKGGNLAEYVGLKASEKDLGRVNGIYNFDGPGFLDANIYQKDFFLIKKFVPKETLIGILLNSQKYEIIDASGRMFAQHHLEAWEVDLENIRFKRIEQRTNGSLLFERTFKEWFATLKAEDIEITIEAALISLDREEDTRISDLEISIRKILSNFLKTKDIPAESKKRIIVNIISLWKIYRSQRKEFLSLNKEEKQKTKTKRKKGTKKKKGGKKNVIPRTKGTPDKGE